MMPIGRLVDGSSMFVEGGGGAAPSNLWIRGPQVGLCYTKLPQLTKEKFVYDNLSNDGYGLMYSTGDQVRFSEVGILELSGRSDSQVKINGIRVEIGSIESVISSCAGVDVCVVLIDENNGRKNLVGFVANRTISSKGWEPMIV